MCHGASVLIKTNQVAAVVWFGWMELCCGYEWLLLYQWDIHIRAMWDFVQRAMKKMLKKSFLWLMERSCGERIERWRVKYRTDIDKHGLRECGRVNKTRLNGARREIYRMRLLKKTLHGGKRLLEKKLLRCCCLEDKTRYISDKALIIWSKYSDNLVH